MSGGRGSRKVDLAEMREQAAQAGDQRLLAMTDRELRAVILENYLPDPDRETVIRTRAVEAGHQ